jgi:hypothetical protein
MSIDFHQTVMGRQFYEATMPRIARSLETLCQLLNKKLPSADSEEQREEDRNVAAFVMREDIANAIESSFLRTINVRCDELVAAIRNVPLPTKSDIENRKEETL